MTKPKLTDTQLVILNAAVDRGDWSLVPVPDTVKAKGNALHRSLRSLLDRGLAKEVEGAQPEQAWRTDDDGRPVGLAITDAGLRAIGAARSEGETPERTADAGPAGEGPAGPDAPKPNSKTAQLVEKLSAEGGASIAELTGAFGWQPHSARAALTGLRKRGYAIERKTSAPTALPPTRWPHRAMTGQIPRSLTRPRIRLPRRRPADGGEGETERRPRSAGPARPGRASRALA